MRLRVLFALCLLAAGCARNLAGQLVSSDENVRQAALRKLEQASPSDRREVIPYLAQNLESDNANLRRRAAQALERTGPDAVNPLIRALQSKNPRTRAAAAEALGHLGADGKGAVGPLVEAGRDADPDVRRWAEVSLGRVKEAMTPAEQNLFRLMYGERAVAAPPAAGAASSHDPRALLEGLKTVPGRDRAGQIAAVVAKGPLAVPAVLAGLKDPDERVRDGAAEALRALTAPAVQAAQKSAPTEVQARLTRELNVLWSAMTARLGRGDLDGALDCFAEARRPDYRTAFLSLGPALPGVAGSLSRPLSFLQQTDSGVLLRGETLIQDVPQRLRVRFAKNDKGEWKIFDF